MGSAIILLHSGPHKGRHFVRLESARNVATPNAAVRHLCRTVERLSSDGRKVWDRAKHKEFSVGYDLRAGARSVEVALSPQTVKRIAALGASVAFTCYRDHDSEQDGCTEPGDGASVPGGKSVAPDR